MAEGYQTEDEQLEALKKWWSENGKSTVITIVVAIVAVLGWQGWEKKQSAEVEAASAIYQNLLLAATGNNGEVTAQQQATANHLASTLKNDFPDSSYALFAAMYRAKFAVADNDLATAEQELQWVLDKNPAQELAQQAQLRLARVLYARQQYPQALAQLSGEAGLLSADFEELRGDIYLAQSDRDAALQAYQKSMELALENGAMPNPLLNMKIQQLQSALGAGPVKASDNVADSEGDA